MMAARPAKRAVFGQAGQLLSGVIGGQLFLLLATLVLARYVRPEEFGVFALFVSANTWLK